MHDPTTARADPAVALVERYIDMWNETDAGRRGAIAAAILTPDALYLDPVMSGEGPEGVSAMVGAAQQQFAGLVFALRGAPQATGDFLRFSWTLGPAGGPPVVAGADFAELRDGRFARIAGFIDQAPGEPPVS